MSFINDIKVVNKTLNAFLKCFPKFENKKKNSTCMDNCHFQTVFLSKSMLYFAYFVNKMSAQKM